MRQCVAWRASTWGFISEKDAGDWAVLRLTETEGSGIRVLGDWNEKGFATVGKWERIASLIPSPGAERAGKYFWATSETAEFQHYWPLNYGGFILAQHYPKKGRQGAVWHNSGAVRRHREMGGRGIPVPREERRSSWEAARRAAAPEAPGRRKSDDRHHGRTAACRGAFRPVRRGRRRPVVDGPADLRLAVAVYLGFAARDEDTPFDYAKNERDARVPPELASAIKKADAKSCASTPWESAAAPPRVLTGNVRVGMKLCRERAMTLKLDLKLRTELNDFFSQAELPPLDSK